MSLINRKITEEINRLKKYYPVITVTGPRQSGKTTLCKYLFPDYQYFNLEDAEILESVRLDPKGFMRAHTGNMIIDEVHHYPELFSLIQIVVDEQPDRKFILTGSSNFALLQSITQSLAGRAAVLTLLPLSLQELGDAIQVMDTDALMLSGGYPRLWAVPDFPRDAFYRNYYTTYIERDVRQIVNIKDMTLFQKFIRLCAGRVGMELNASNLSNEVGVATSTITNWLSMLSASYIAYLLPPYFANVRKRLVKTPKFYFYDVGLACYLLGIESTAQLSVHPLRGNLFENMVINEAVKNRLNQGKDPNLYFYRDKSQNEVDLIYEQGEALQAYEIKSAQTFNKEFYKGILYVKNLFGDKIARSAVIYDGDYEVIAQENGFLNFRHFQLS